MTDTAQLYRKNKEAAKQILKEFPKNGTISAAKLKGRLQDDKRVTSRIKDAALAIDKTGEPLPKAYEWIADNYYLLDEKFRDLLPILRKFPHIQREEATVTPLPRYYMIFIRYLEYLERNAASFDDSAVEAFLAACFAYEAESPSIDDIYSFPDFVWRGGYQPYRACLRQPDFRQKLAKKSCGKAIVLFCRFA